MDFGGVRWTSVGLRWSSVDFGWISVEFNSTEVQPKSTEVHRTPPKPTEVHRSPTEVHRTPPKSNQNPPNWVVGGVTLFGELVIVPDESILDFVGFRWICRQREVVPESYYQECSFIPRHCPYATVPMPFLNLGRSATEAQL